MMSNFPEIGYTPANLRYLIEEVKKLTQKETALILDVSEIQVRRWLMPIDAPNHRDMPLKKWMQILAA
jgi:hypothetical protein